MRFFSISAAILGLATTALASKVVDLDDTNFDSVCASQLIHPDGTSVFGALE